MRTTFSLACTIGSLLGLFPIEALSTGTFLKGNPQHGKVVYEENCVECHGHQGDGNSPVGRLLATRPADFLASDSRAKTDDTLFAIIREGSRYDEMHGWEDELSEQDMWDVLRYIRTLAPYKPAKRE